MTNRVYSTEAGRICPACDRPSNNCSCKNSQHEASGDGTIRIGRETKGRKGAGVTIVAGAAGDSDAIKSLARRLKQHCSSGGAVKHGIIEIQGDHRLAIKALLEKEGHRVTLAGG